MQRVMFNVWVEISNKWGQRVSTGTCSVYYIHCCNREWGTLSKFSDNTKLSSAVDTPEGQNALQRNLEKPEEWFNKTKCKVQHLEQGSPCYQYSR